MNNWKENFNDWYINTSGQNYLPSNMIVDWIEKNIVNDVSKTKASALIQAQLEIVQGYYNKIFMDKLDTETVLNMLENDRIYLQQEQNLLDACNLPEAKDDGLPPGIRWK